MKNNLKLILSYDGTNYFGWQKVKEGPSIEEILEKNLKQVLSEDITLQAASRTDRGVHAEGQVANFFTAKKPDLRRLHWSLNCMLPKDIRLLSIESVDSNFHPTLDAVGKEYHYLLSNSPSQLPFHRKTHWHYPYHELNLEKMKKHAQEFVGVHDFAPYANLSPSSPSNTIREIRRFDIVQLPENNFRFEIEGKSFLYNMVRNLVGSVVILSSGKPPRKLTAPSHGLLLKKVIFI